METHQSINIIKQGVNVTLKTTRTLMKPRCTNRYPGRINFTSWDHLSKSLSAIYRFPLSSSSTFSRYSSRYCKRDVTLFGVLKQLNWSPILRIRFENIQINSSAGGGVLLEEKYFNHDGIRATAWVGSPKILQLFDDKNGRPVKYGRDWVLSAVYTTGRWMCLCL